MMVSYCVLLVRVPDSVLFRIVKLLLLMGWQHLLTFIEAKYLEILSLILQHLESFVLFIKFNK